MNGKILMDEVCWIDCNDAAGKQLVRFRVILHTEAESLTEQHHTWFSGELVKAVKGVSDRVSAEIADGEALRKKAKPKARTAKREHRAGAGDAISGEATDAGRSKA